MEIQEVGSSLGITVTRKRFQKPLTRVFFPICNAVRNSGEEVSCSQNTQWRSLVPATTSLSL